MFYWIIYALANLISWFWFPITVIARNHLPRGAFILACNHVSYLDPVIIGSCIRRRMSFMAKGSLFKNKWLGACLRGVDTFPVKRGTADIGAIKEAIRRLKEGRPLVVFPEGTRLHAAGEARPHPGIALIAKKTKVPIVPVLIKGSFEVLPPGAKFFKRHNITVLVGPPRNYQPTDSPEAVAEKILQDIYSLSV